MGGIRLHIIQSVDAAQLTYISAWDIDSSGYGDFMHVLNLSELARRRAISRLLRLTSHSPTALVFCMTEIETKS